MANKFYMTSEMQRASDRWVEDYLSNPIEFSVQFQGNKKLCKLFLKNNLTTLEALKLKIEDMYGFKYGKQIKIEKIAFYESYISLDGDSAGYDDAKKEYHWTELESDGCVQMMWSGLELHPPPYRLYATLAKV
jgi:hypothetical protein